MSVRNVRRRLAAELTEHGVKATQAQDALLVVSELVGNALRHARPIDGAKLKVSWRWRGQQLEVAVTDGGGPSRPQVVHPPASAVGGRGLSIVNELAERWGVDCVDGLTRVYAVLPVR